MPEFGGQPFDAARASNPVKDFWAAGPEGAAATADAAAHPSEHEWHNATRSQDWQALDRREKPTELIVAKDRCAPPARALF